MEHDRCQSHPDSGTLHLYTPRGAVSVRWLLCFVFQCQATVVVVLGSIVAIVVGAINSRSVRYDHALLLCASSLVTASVASFVLGNETLSSFCWFTLLSISHLHLSVLPPWLRCGGNTLPLPLPKFHLFSLRTQIPEPLNFRPSCKAGVLVAKVLPWTAAPSGPFKIDK